MGVPGAVAEVAAAQQVVVGVDIEAVRARPVSRACAWHADGER